MDGLVYDLTVEAMRVLILVAAPITAVIALVSTLISALQSATAIHDQALSYAVKVLTLLFLIYLLLPTAVESLTTLTEMALK